MAYSNKLDCVRWFLKKSRLGWVSPFQKIKLQRYFKALFWKFHLHDRFEVRNFFQGTMYLVHASGMMPPSYFQNLNWLKIVVWAYM